MATNQQVVYSPRPQVSIQGHYGPLTVTRVDLKNRVAWFRASAPDGSIGPEFEVPISMIRPLGPEDIDPFWKEIVKNLMEELKAEGKYPSFLKGVQVSTADDSTGDPAIYVKLLVEPKLKYPDKTMSEWLAFSDLVHDRLRSLGISRYPYVTMGEKRRGR